MQVTVDIGKSGTRARVRGADRPDHESSGLEPSRAGASDGAKLVADVIAAAVDGVLHRGESEQVTSVVIGSTAAPATAADTLAALNQRWPATRIALFEDQIVSHAAALGDRGVVATVGTGIGIAGLDADGALLRVDGWGPDLGDRGSAWQIGRDGLRAGFAARDGVGTPTLLEEAADKFCGGISLRSAVELLAADDRVARISSFARTVCELDDLVARAIVVHATDDLLDSVSAALDRTRTTTVVFRGRLLCNDSYRQLLHSGSERRGWDLRTAVTDVLDVDHGLLFAPPYREHALAATSC